MYILKELREILFAFKLPFKLIWITDIERLERWILFIETSEYQGFLKPYFVEFIRLKIEILK